MRYYIKLTLIILFITSSVMSLKRPNKRVIKKKSEIVVMPVFNRHNMSRCDAG
jgi:hypothetical protein